MYSKRKRAITDLSHTMTDELNAFSFRTGDSLFAINLDEVLSIEQDSMAGSDVELF